MSDLEDLRALEQPIRSAIALSPRAVVVFININPDLSRARRQLPQRPAAGRIALCGAPSYIIDRSLLLVAGTVAALVWANVWPASYGGFAHGLHFAVNDIGMVFFFGLATKEIVESTLPGGPLASPKAAAVPLLAAAAGMIAPAGLYWTAAVASGHPELARGWAIPCATDIAFSYLVARLIFPERHPAIPFLLLLAVADDALGLLVLAVFYPAGAVSPLLCALFMVPAVAIAWGLRRRRVRSFWPYIVLAGSCSWTGLYLGGLHPALALVPIVPFMLREVAVSRPVRRGLSSTPPIRSTGSTPGGACPCR